MSELVTDLHRGEAAAPLSARETQILFFVVKGVTNRVIALALGISPKTVTNHVHAIIHKLGVANRTQAAMWAWRTGLVKVSQPRRPRVIW